MLISPQEVMQRLEQERLDLMTATFTNPPQDYAGFAKALGAYAKLVAVQQLIRELAQRKED